MTASYWAARGLVPVEDAGEQPPDADRVRLLLTELGREVS